MTGRARAIADLGRSQGGTEPLLYAPFAAQACSCKLTTLTATCPLACAHLHPCASACKRTHTLHVLRGRSHMWRRTLAGRLLCTAAKCESAAQPPGLTAASAGTLESHCSGIQVTLWNVLPRSFWFPRARWLAATSRSTALLSARCHATDARKASPWHHILASCTARCWWCGNLPVWPQQQVRTSHVLMAPIDGRNRSWLSDVVPRCILPRRQAAFHSLAPHLHCSHSKL